MTRIVILAARRTPQGRGQFRHELVAMEELARDEHPRPETSLEQLAALRPAFKAGGTVTAGNAAGIDDGAAMALESARPTGTRRPMGDAP